jgi:hypothetical protein
MTTGEVTLVRNSSCTEILKKEKKNAVWRGFGLVVRAAGWHVRDPGSILGRDSLYTFGCIPQHFESALAEVLRYVKTLVYFFYFLYKPLLKMYHCMLAFSDKEKEEREEAERRRKEEERRRREEEERRREEEEEEKKRQEEEKKKEEEEGVCTT